MPSASSLAEQGLKAFNAGNYSEAIDYYSQALSANPEVPDYYLKRSTAYQRTSQPELALHDADLAVMLANKRGKREMVGSAQLRRGIALHLLGRHGDARFCIAEAEKRCTGKELNMVAMWSKKLEAVMEKLDDDDVAREVTIPQVPAVDVPGASQKITELESEVPAAKPVISPPPPAPAGVVTPAGKIRHEWYQTPNNVVLTLYVKGVPKDQAAVEINEKTLSITFPLSSGNDFVFDIDPFFDDVDPSKSSYSILSTKVEVTLVKARPNKKWADLEGVHAEKENETAVEKPVADKPYYPSSSKTGPKDWDKLATELTAKPKNKGKGKEGETTGDEEYDSEDGGDPVNFFFKKLYKDADEDTRRAMMKSYTESNGTALSTNWGEVGQGKVETSPPEGMTAKKWEE